VKLESRVWGSKGHLQYMEDIGGTKFVTDFNLQSVKTFRTKMSLSHLNSNVNVDLLLESISQVNIFFCRGLSPEVHGLNIFGRNKKSGKFQDSNKPQGNSLSL